MLHPREKCLAQSQLFFFEGCAEPGPGKLPVPVGNGAREPKCLCRFLNGEPAEQVELSDLRGIGVFLAEPGEKFVQRQDEIGVLGEGIDLIEQLDPLPAAAAAALLPVAAAGVVYQDSPHRFRRGGEEVGGSVKALVGNQSKVGLVDQSRGIKGMARGFGGHLGGGKPPQLVVDVLKELICRPAVTGGGGVQEVRDLGHDKRVYRVERWDSLDSPRSVRLSGVARLSRVHECNSRARFAGGRLYITHRI
jgi:hypothetical protein